MAQRASFAVLDRETTPLSHTFVPRSPADSSVVLFAETATVPIGERTFTISTRKTGTKYRTRIKLESPVLVTEVINGVSRPSVPRIAYADLTFTFEDTSTAQERANVVGMFANSLAAAQTMINATLVNLEAIW